MGTSKHTRLAVGMSAFSLAIAVTMIVFTKQVVALGQILAYNVSGGTLEGVIRTPTAVSVIAMALLCVIMAISIKCVVEGLWSLYKLRMSQMGSVITATITGVCSVLVLLTFSMMPSMATSAWLGALMVTIACIVVYFAMPNGNEVSLVPVYRHHAHDVRVIGEVMEGNASVIVRTKGERRQAIEMLAGVSEIGSK